MTLVRKNKNLTHKTGISGLMIPTNLVSSNPSEPIEPEEAA
jgi:hypothetical protein